MNRRAEFERRSEVLPPLLTTQHAPVTPPTSKHNLKAYPMKTFEQLAQAAYAAYCKQAGGKTYDDKPLPEFSALGEKVTANWVAAVKQVAAEIAAIH